MSCCRWQLKFCYTLIYTDQERERERERSVRALAVRLAVHYKTGELRYAKVYYSSGRFVVQQRQKLFSLFRSLLCQLEHSAKVNKKRRVVPRKRRARVERMEINRFQKRELLPCRSRFNRKTQTIIRFLTSAHYSRRSEPY